MAKLKYYKCKNLFFKTKLRRVKTKHVVGEEIIFVEDIHNKGPVSYGKKCVCECFPVLNIILLNKKTAQ